MTELQIILIVCALVFVGSLYWWGKKSNNEPMQRPFRHDPLPAETSEEEGFEVIPVTRREQVREAPELGQSSLALEPSEIAQPIEEHVISDVGALESRMSHLDTVSVKPVQAPAHEDVIPLTPEDRSYSEQITQPVQSQLFALLILSASAKFTRKQLHVAMEGSRLNFHNDGTYIKQDTSGNIIFRVANVVEPGFFPAVEDDSFASPGVALVLELPSSITPYRAMDEFITVARKVSQNLGAKLYDAQRHLIKESDLKAMREYAQGLTY